MATGNYRCKLFDLLFGKMLSRSRKFHLCSGIFQALPAQCMYSVNLYNLDQIIGPMCVFEIVFVVMRHKGFTYSIVIYNQICGERKFHTRVEVVIFCILLTGADYVRSREFS